MENDKRTNSGYSRRGVDNSDSEDIREQILKNRKSRRKKKAISSAIKVVLFFVFIYAAWKAFGAGIAEKYAASTERKDLNEWFEVQGNEVRVYNDDLVERNIFGIYDKGEVYLPYSYVYERINNCFYYGEQDRTLFYSLPDETLMWDENSLEDGYKALLFKDNELYVSAAIAENYSNITINNHAGEEDTAKRIFIENGGRSVRKCTIRRDSAVRTKGGIKSPILTDIHENDTVTLINSMETWAKVVTDDGFVGYTEIENLADNFEYTYPVTYTLPLAEQISMDEKIILAWNFISNSSANDKIESIITGSSSAINVVSPTWIQIKDAEGNYENFSSADYVNKAHELGAKVWVSVDNFNLPGGLNDFNTGDYFGKFENRKSFIDRLMTDAVTYGYDGFNLDFESLSEKSALAYVQFFKELSIACHEKGLVLSIDNYVPYHFNDYYRLDEQGRFADYVIIMGYDEHTKGTEAGSVASLPYTEYGITESLKYVSAERLINAVPFFTRVWTISGDETTSEVLNMKDTDNYLSNNGIRTVWDEGAGQYYGETAKGNITTKIWVEEGKSIYEKVSLIKENNLAGVAAWRAGLENKEIWSILDLNLSASKSSED